MATLDAALAACRRKEAREEALVAERIIICFPPELASLIASYAGRTPGELAAHEEFANAVAMRALASLDREVLVDKDVISLLALAVCTAFVERGNTTDLAPAMFEQLLGLLYQIHRLGGRREAKKFISFVLLGSLVCQAWNLESAENLSGLPSSLADFVTSGSSLAFEQRVSDEDKLLPLESAARTRQLSWRTLKSRQKPASPCLKTTTETGDAHISFATVAESAISLSNVARMFM